MALYPAENEHERILPKSEADILYKRMAATWGVGRHYWWPLSDPRPAHAEGFQDWFFEQEFGYATLRRILTEHGVSSVFEFREDGAAYQVRVATFEPCCTGLEGFWTTDRLDWIIYASHEGSVTVGGEWLLPAVQAAWPSWERRVWTSPFYERPQ
jgi:hypothetical protein